MTSNLFRRLARASAVTVFSLALSLNLLAATITAPGAIATDFTVTNRTTQKAMKLSDFAGQIVVLDFFAYWCGPCQSSSPEVETKIQLYYDGQGGNIDGIPVTVIGINIESGAPASTDAFIAAAGMTLVGDDFPLGQGWAEFGQGYIPHFVVINGLADSTSHRQWEVLYTGYGYPGYAALRTHIDSIRRPPVPLAINAQPVSKTATSNEAAALSVEAHGWSAIEWYRNGRKIADASGEALVFEHVAPDNAGIYDVIVSKGDSTLVSAPAVLGVVPPTDSRTAGSVSTRAEWQDIHHPNGHTYDQYLLSGTAGTFTADPGEIARMSYLDENGSIVQVEMSGAGAITVALDAATASGPKVPALYNQSGIEYMQGKATIILAGADTTTHFTIYSVGTATNPGVTRPDVVYAGWADVAASGIVSTDGKLGGIHQGNVRYRASAGQTGIYAPTVNEVGGLVVVHGIEASETAQPYLLFGTGGTVDLKIAGTSLAQPNGEVVTVGGLARVTMGAGQDSCGRAAPAQPIGTRLVDANDNDVTGAVVKGP